MAMENHPFTNDFFARTQLKPGLSIAMFDFKIALLQHH
jgi:hypothetical protein